MYKQSSACMSNGARGDRSRPIEAGWIPEVLRQPSEPGRLGRHRRSYGASGYRSRHRGSLRRPTSIRRGGFRDSEVALGGGGSRRSLVFSRREFPGRIPSTAPRRPGVLVPVDSSVGLGKPAGSQPWGSTIHQWRSAGVWTDRSREPIDLGRRGSRQGGFRRNRTRRR